MSDTSPEGLALERRRKRLDEERRQVTITLPPWFMWRWDRIVSLVAAISVTAYTAVFCSEEFRSFVYGMYAGGFFVYLWHCIEVQK